MKKRIVTLIISVVLIIIAVGALNNQVIVDACDNAILLEKRHPGYWEYLKPERMIEVKTVPGFEKVSTGELQKNNLIQDVNDYPLQGINVSTEGTKLHYKGIANEMLWPEVADLSWINSGTYFISRGNTKLSDGINFYLEGLQGENNVGISSANIGNCFYIDSSLYEKVKLTAAIPPSKYIDEWYEPILYKISDDNLIDKSQTRATWQSIEKDAITTEDIKLLFNSMSNSLPLSGCTLVFTNGEASDYIKTDHRIEHNNAYLNKYGFEYD